MNKEIEEVVNVMIEEVEDRLYGMNININQKEYRRIFAELKQTLPKPFTTTLTTLLENERKRVIEMVEGMKYPEEKGGTVEMPYTKMTAANSSCAHEVFGQFFYNQALDDIITQLKTLDT